jgi:DNA-binding transcriptional MerR regulator
MVKTPMHDSYSISEAAKHASVTVHQVRIYVQLGLVVPCETTSSGHRRYNRACVERLRLIHAAVQSGLLLGEMSVFFQALDNGNRLAMQREQATLVARLAARRRAVQTCKALLSRLADRVSAPHPVEEVS